MAKSQATKKLLVEGEEDKRVIPQVIEKNGIDWIQNNEPIVRGCLKTF